MSLAWIFPGQGAQAVGMGKDVFAQSAAARAVFEQADAALGEKLSALCFDGPLETLTLTANTQPAIVTTSMALLAALRERCPTMPAPVCAAGHSLGEYSALCAAGALALADAVRITRIRGQAMQEAVPAGQGAMAAVMAMDDAALGAICIEVTATGQVVSPANYNAPGQTVISGSAEGVARASELIKGKGAKVIPLNVSAPFHCELMAPAAKVVLLALAEARVADASFDVLANVDAKPRREAHAIRQALHKQIGRPVQWVSTIEAMRARGVTHLLEIGPGKVLAGLVKRVDKTLVVANVSDAQSLDKAGDFLATLQLG